MDEQKFLIVTSVRQDTFWIENTVEYNKILVRAKGYAVCGHINKIQLLISHVISHLIALLFNTYFV